MSWILPIGVDRGDGVTPLPLQPEGTEGTNTFGTPDPSGYLLTYSNEGSVPTLEQQPDAPEIERAEQATFSNTLRGSWEGCVSMLGNLGRGTFIEDSASNIWRILSSKIKSMQGNMGELSVVGESISFDTPPDEFSIDSVELGINIIKHPRYFPFLNSSTANPVDGTNDFNVTVGTNPNTCTVAQIKQAVIRAIQTYIDSPWQPGGNSINGLIQNSVINAFNTNQIPIGSNNNLVVNPGGNQVCAFAIAAAGEIIQKLWKQEDTPYIPSFQVTWSQYSFKPQNLLPGALILSPIGIVPYFFISPSQMGPDTIFDDFPELNPQIFGQNGTTAGPAAFTWLLKADTVVFERTWWKTTHTWIGSPVGSFDQQLFTGNPRVTQPIDQNGIVGFLPLPLS